MSDTPVGIGDISIYIPPPKIDLKELVKHRIEADPSLRRRLERALETTGQRAMRYPEPWQDSVTMAAQAADALITRNTETDLAGMRYLSVGSETSVDMSKPIAAYVQGVLQKAGKPLPDTLSTFQVQHACAGGTIAMMSIGALLQAADRTDETGMVLCTDIARYDVPSTAEITQGAGAVGLLIETNPRLLSLDLKTQGFCSRDVDDFFRPLGSVTAKVKGGYSVQCYHEAMEVAFNDHCRRRHEAPDTVLRETDIFVFHVPFIKMAYIAAHRVLGTYLGLAGESLDHFLEERGFSASIQPAAEIGNIYTGAAYMCLAYNLDIQYNKFGDGIVGKKVLIASYGSGNTITVLSGTVAAGAPEVIRRWDLDSALDSAVMKPITTYEDWTRGPFDQATYNSLLGANTVPPGEYYLAGIREDGYREYEKKI